MALSKKTTDTDQAPVQGATTAESAKIKYPKPKILLLDLPDSARETLTAKGFNVIGGTLGRPYKVDKSSGSRPLIGECEVPNHSEQEIVIVELAYDKLAPGPKGTKHRPDEETDLWGKCDRGFLDPRARAAYQLIKSFDRILSAGGIFIIFADEKTGIDLELGALNRYGQYYSQESFNRDAWHFLTELFDLEVLSDYGEEISSTDMQSPVGRLLAEYLPGSQFNCTLRGGHRYEDQWQTLAKNKFDQAVAICRCRTTHGTVIVLPQLKDKVGFLVRLIGDVLPEIAPHLFPYSEEGKWTHSPEYELTQVMSLKAKQAEIIKRAGEEIRAIDVELEKERAIHGWIQSLLTGTDTQLVTSVKKALEEFGFKKVVDVDVERDREGKSRREDLQIHDESPLLVVDVKGIGGFPSDEDALQADKHAAIRMREMKRTDIVGLSIINHQRHLPPLERENETPFRQELLDAAEERTLGLMTSWDLYRLLKNATKLGWDGKYVRPIFYKRGRIMPVPTHYSYIGKIAKAWTDKFGVIIDNGELHVGDKIAVEFPVEFEEVAVNSIRVDDVNVASAKAGDRTGILWPTQMPKVKEGMKVFCISAAR